jgi:hypothetical protein
MAGEGIFSGTCARATGVIQRIARVAVVNVFSKRGIIGIFPEMAMGVNLNPLPQLPVRHDNEGLRNR